MENKIIGYRVRTSDYSYGRPCYVHYDGFRHFVSSEEPEPISQADAYRRLAGFLESGHTGPIPTVVPVLYVPTPIETASAELGDLLQDLCKRHGLRLGLSGDQVEKRIAQELSSLGAAPIVDQIRRLI